MRSAMKENLLFFLNLIIIMIIVGGGISLIQLHFGGFR